MRQRRIRKWSDEQLVDAVKSSTSYADVIRCLKLGYTGGNVKTLKYWIAEFNLDTSHWNNEKQLAGLTKRKALALEDVLVENSSASQATIRRIALKIFEYKCVECGNEGFHNGRSLKLQLDHKNGNRKDNRRENLRWLCPNCHTQTDTYAGKKAFVDGVIDARKRCTECGNILHDNHALHCRPCADKRRQLYCLK